MDVWKKLHKSVVFVILFIYVLTIEGQTEKPTTDVFSLIDEVRLPLQYCSVKYATRNSKYAHRCIRKWNIKYEQFCKNESNRTKSACARLKKKMQKAIEKFSRQKMKSRLEQCDIGKKTDRQFESVTQFCCEKHIWKKKYRDGRVCCDKRQTDGTRTTCCNITVINLQSLKKASCCHGYLIDDMVETCPVINHTADVGHSNNDTNMSAVLPKSGFEHRFVATDRPTTNLKEQLAVDQHETTAHGNSLIILYICVPVALVAFTVAGFVLLSHRCKLKNLERQNFTSDNHPYGSCGTTIMQINPASSVRSQTSTNQNTISNKGKATFFPNKNKHSDFQAKVTLTELRNICLTDQVNVQTQTDLKKGMNIKNSMGRDFCVSHTFKSNKRTLKIPDSAVSLTLSETDVVDQHVTCYASTFRNLWENYWKLEDVMSKDEVIVTPAVEYFFPVVKRLKAFACIDMPIGERGRDFRVWKVTSDQGVGKANRRDEIPNKKHVDINDEDLDAYYELVDGKVRIYIKSFSWLVCSVCKDDHYGFNLAARVYTSSDDNGEEGKNVQVTLYILDGVRQLEDYLKVINDSNENPVKLYRKINLPNHVSLEDCLSIRVFLLSESATKWALLFDDDESVDTEVPLHDITQCQKINTNGHPYSVDWYYKSVPYSIDVVSITFQCAIQISIMPQHHVSMNVTRNRWVITEKVDFSNVKKTRNVRDDDISNRESIVWNPVSSLENGARYVEPRSEISKYSGSHHRHNQRAFTQLDLQEMPQTYLNKTHHTSPELVQRPVDYEALGARPKANHHGNIPAECISSARRQPEAPNQNQDINSSNNFHSNGCQGARVSGNSVCVNENKETYCVRGEINNSST